MVWQMFCNKKFSFTIEFTSNGEYSSNKTHGLAILVSSFLQLKCFSLCICANVFASLGVCLCVLHV